MNDKLKKTRGPVIAGSLCIISGIFGILGILNYSVGIFGEAGSGFGKGDIPPFVPSIIFDTPIPALIVALVALVGGIFAFRRKKWLWALICAIAAACSFILTGIPAVILLILTKDEFTS
ncbi:MULTISPECIES: hypothetical protein [Dehalococcoides]|jgi:hypothetical protein|uniref:Uncharacterized protein n=2 Tax=Dehalococcoides mccartyi TaxID=61435 RepID=A0A1S7H2N0_9CHLR|nr:MULTISPECIES: hypothetical protein [Dehalococcoides]AGG07030.1 hypothetical protein dcmb_1441 [Dehalococcoides mccartyi DCMB5]AQX73855.1 hypothetical protein B1775_06845 [Dehalococcoides mccartyi]AQX75230.1 hypothetical protein B1776_06765 [Dehalococcoides mccartyi]AQY73807.1 hypothetical protein B1772_07075 [Dehalococcoides mccartyi]PKH45111.1 hypothetical protein KKB3_01330 [Dehalococcoides mccartyi]